MIQNGKAHELFINGAPELHPSLEIIKDYQGTVEAGWEWDGAVFTAPAGPTAEEKLAALRGERDYKIAATDWWASSDLTMTQAQIDYRQALRDITLAYSSLDDVVWPTKP